MADKDIPALTALTGKAPLTALVEISDSGTTKKSTIQQILDNVLDGVASAFDTLAEVAAALSGKLSAGSNLSDLTDAGAARNNLGTTPLSDPAYADANTYLTYPASGVSISNGIVGANTLIMVPIWVVRTRTFSTYALGVTTLAASAAIRIGLYNSVNGLPTTKIDEATTPIDASTGTGSTGLKTAAFAVNQSLKPGLYFIALLANASPSVVRMNTPQGGGILGTFLSATSAAANTGLSRALTYGTLPADESASTFTPTANGASQIPFPGIK